jgi:hypothetical protein
MDHNVKLEIAKQYLRDRKKYICEQDQDDPTRFVPRKSVETDVKQTWREYQHEQNKSKQQAPSPIRFFDRKIRYQK